MWKANTEKKEMQGIEITSNNVPAPLAELLDGFMEQMVRLTGDVNKIKQGVWALVGEIRRLVRVVERWMERDEKTMELNRKKDEEKVEEKKGSELEMEDELEKRNGDRDREEEEENDKKEKENGEVEEGEERDGDEKK